MKRAIFALSFFGLVFCLSLTPVSAQDDAAQKALEGIKYWNKWIEARGGKDRLSKVTSYKSTADAKILSQGLNLTIITYKKGLNKYRIDQKVMGMTITQALNGDTGWITNPQTGFATDMPAEVKGQMGAPANEHEALLDPIQFGHKVTYEGRQTIDGKEYIMLNQTAPNGVVCTQFIDAETFLRYKYKFASNNVDTEVFESDYRNVDGIKVPFLSRQAQNGKDVAIITTTEFVYNTNLDDSLFAKPQ